MHWRVLYNSKVPNDRVRMVEENLRETDEAAVRKVVKQVLSEKKSKKHAGRVEGLTYT